MSVVGEVTLGAIVGAMKLRRVKVAVRCLFGLAPPRAHCLLLFTAIFVFSFAGRSLGSKFYGNVSR